MYIFYTDKTELFECNIQLQGAKMSDSKARLILESDDYNLIFYGTVDKNGKCTIPVKKLKSVLSENTSGNVKLEVIAEDTYFEPWKDTFTVETNKKVTVEVKSNTTKPTINESKTKVHVTVKSNLSPITEEVLKLFKKKKVTLFNLTENKQLLSTVGIAISKKYKLSDNEIKTLIGNVIQKL
jgi:hypothetical protein